MLNNYEIYHHESNKQANKTFGFFIFFPPKSSPFSTWFLLARFFHASVIFVLEFTFANVLKSWVTID